LNEEEKKLYMKDKKSFVRFLIRCPDELLNKYKEDFGYGTCKKSDNSEIRDKVIEYSFDVVPYGNDKSKEMNVNHSVVVCKNEDIQEIKDKLKVSFPNVVFRMKLPSITTQLDPSECERGIWKSVGEEEEIKYPICVLSYDRHDKNGKTHLTLSKYKIKHYLFIEPCEKELYEEWINKDYCELVVLPSDFHLIGMGSTSVRNYILKWGREHGYERVWMLDDNIKKYLRLLQGVKNEIISNEIFTSIEKYVNRYDNVGLVSHNFNPFVNEGDCRCCIVKNNKCYSSMLIKTHEDIIFRYKHQEDNLISIEYINKGYTNLCFNHMLYDKDTSGKNKGGNHSVIYKVKEGETDGSGYNERFEYFEMILKILLIEGKLKLREGRKTTDLMKRSTTMKTKEYHSKMDYSHLEGYNNEIFKKNNYDDIVSSEKKSNLELIIKKV
tara:strand:+ start:825 stop:2138 length:1314 start_codon:yes stop_codon:yes gene_type:complete